MNDMLSNEAVSPSGDTLRPERISRAAQWLADQSRNPVPVIPALRGQYGLSIDEAHQAVVLAGRMRMLREAFA
jgi:hypothetical protein